MIEIINILEAFFRIPEATGLVYRADPVTIGLLIAGTAVSAASSIKQGREADAQAKFQQKIANRNAEMAYREAEAKRVAAAELAIEKGKEARAFQGAQRAAIAKSGVAAGRGSPLSVLIDTAQEFEVDRLNIIRQGAISGQQLESQGDMMIAEGKAARQRGKAAKKASVLTALGQGLSGGASAGMSASKLNSLQPAGQTANKPLFSVGLTP